ncbi:hypothetical protein E3P77_04114 [Wallemia ichthyophaga]|nr:hypothetical protein E3P77_04114 [Wallemia ichthyophaga]
MRINFIALLSIVSWISAQETPQATNAVEPDQSGENAEQCTPYSAPIVQDNLGQFPPLWETAKIVQGDTTAQNKYDEIKQVIPSSIKPKGTHDGNISDVSYDASDPDCWFTSTKCTHPKVDGLSDDLATLPEPNTWGLGFDDGPNCSHNEFYNFLSDNDLTATMFYIGSNVMNWPHEAQRGREDGHELCVHTWSHHYMTSFDDEGAFAELYYSIQAIKLVTGVTPTCWRPPFGDIDDRIRIIAEGLGLRTVLWELDTNDWKMINGKTKDDVRKNYLDVFDAAESGVFEDHGTIVLTHEITAETMEMFIEMYPNIRDNFDYVVPLSVATNRTNLYVEEETERGEVFADYVNDHYGSTVNQATSINTNIHPNPTLTGWQGPLATIANPTVAEVEAATEPTTASSSSSSSSSSAGSSSVSNDSGNDDEEDVEDDKTEHKSDDNIPSQKSNPFVYNYPQNTHSNNGASSGGHTSITKPVFTMVALFVVTMSCIR